MKLKVEGNKIVNSQGEEVVLKGVNINSPGILKYGENHDFLNPDIFTDQFYTPAVEILDSMLHGFIFEQEYHRKKNRIPVNEMAKDFDFFFSSIPKDDRYHIELRTESYLSPAVFEVMQNHRIGQVLSHWTWLPKL